MLHNTVVALELPIKRLPLPCLKLLTWFHSATFHWSKPILHIWVDSKSWATRKKQALQTNVTPQKLNFNQYKLFSSMLKAADGYKFMSCP